MTFENLFNQTCRIAHLPEMARLQLPNSLSNETKKKAMRLTPEEFGYVLTTSIDKVNNGSIESLDTLVNREITRRGF